MSFGFVGVVGRISVFAGSPESRDGARHAAHALVAAAVVGDAGGIGLDVVASSLLNLNQPFQDITS